MTASETMARMVTVHGRVQGVGFRYYCVAEAARLGVVGWVSNEDDGTVVGHFEGSSQAVDALVDWCRSGPAYAAVQEVEVRPAEPTGARTFSVR